MQSNHYLHFEADDVTRASVIRHLRDKDIIPDIMNDDLQGEEAVKWRSKTEDMVFLSWNFPDVVFQLNSVDLDGILEVNIYHHGTAFGSKLVDPETTVPDVVGTRVFRKIILTDPRVYLMRLFRK